MISKLFFANLVTIEVMEILQSENAVLLPQVYERFQTLALQYQGKISETTNDYHLPMSRWLLTYLNNKMGSYMSTVTKHKRYGVVIYKTNGDLLLALSKALHDAKHTGKTKMQIQQEYRDVSDETTLKTAYSYINKLILREIDILSNKY